MTKLLSGLRILIVEDEMLVLMNIEMALADLGCSMFVAAGNVSAALVQIKQHKFDAAILDVNLAGETSYPIADELARRGVPFAFSTGYGDHGDRADLNDRPVLRKPYLHAALVAVLNQLLGAPLPAAA